MIFCKLVLICGKMAVGVAKVEEDSGMRFHMSKYVGVNMFLNLYPACKGFHF
jgi:hypothetical protein